MKIVVALGGNALERPGARSSYDEQVKNVRTACTQLVEMIRRGHSLVLTHGNGPQVGSIAIQESATTEVPQYPLHVMDAMTQGEIGYIIQRELGNLLRAAGIAMPVVSLVTQVLVDRDDPAFDVPSKPIGPFYSAEEAERLRREKGFIVDRVQADGEKPYRRVVPSPDPLVIIEAEAVRTLVRSGAVVVAGGGGGVPVFKSATGEYVGVDAVVDKDLCAERLAEATEADELLILTNVEKVKVNYGTKEEKDLDRVGVSEAKRLMDEGQFPAGTMGPKVQACIRFVERTGKTGRIASLGSAIEALEGIAGTAIVPG